MVRASCTVIRAEAGHAQPSLVHEPVHPSLAALFYSARPGAAYARGCKISPMMIQRGSTRTRTLLQARIDFNGGLTTIECTVRDLSETGARLEVPASVALPARFQLSVPKLGRKYQAYTKWQRSGFVGIAFEQQASAAGSSEQDPEQRVAKLEAEVAKLRRVVEAIRADPSQARLLLEKFELAPTGL